MDEIDWEYEFEESLKGVAEWIEGRLIDKAEEYDLDVSGELLDSIRVDVSDSDDEGNSIINVNAVDYGFVLNKGLSGRQVKRSGTNFEVARRPSERTFNIDGGRIGVSFRDIFDWVRARGISFASTTRGTATIITRSIRNKGYKARPWIDDVLIDELPEIDRRIEKALDATAEVGIDATITDNLGDTSFGTATFR